MTRLCDKCAKKLEGMYCMELIGGRCEGFCPVCWAMTETQNYDIMPRRIRYERRAGGGERQKAWEA